MPKRIGFLYEKVITPENCKAAIFEGTANLVKTRKIRNIRENADAYAMMILEDIKAGWVPEPTRLKIINEGTGHKIRHLRIPTTHDHIIHVAIMRVIIPKLEKRYDFYSCGSIQGRGQKRVRNAIKSWMREDHPVNYGGEEDIHHAYQSTKADVVMKQLRRFIKDEKYLHLHELILEQMGGTLAIGFQPSHWYFNLVMTPVDQTIRRECKGIGMVRYMDNYDFSSNRKRTIHKAIRVSRRECEKIGLSINRNWQVYPTRKRAIVMLSYRYFPGYIILRKPTMYQISKGVKTAGKKPCAHLARGAMSQIGLLRHCNSYHFRKKHVYPVISIKRSKELISRADKKRLLCGKA